MNGSRLSAMTFPCVAALAALIPTAPIQGAQRDTSAEAVDCLQLSHLDADPAVPRETVGRLKRQFLERLVYDRTFQMIFDHADFRLIEEMLLEESMMRPPGRTAGADSRPVPVDRAPQACDERSRRRYYLAGTVSLLPSGRLLLAMKLLDRSGRLLQPVVAECGTASVSDQRIPDCMREISVKLYLALHPTLPDPSRGHGRVVAVQEMTSDFVDSGGLADLSRQYLACLRRDGTRQFRELRVPPIQPGLLHPELAVLDNLGLPLDIAFRIAEETSAGWVLTTAINRADDGHTAFIEGRLVKLSEGSVRAWSEKTLLNPRSNEDYLFALARVACQLFPEACPSPSHPQDPGPIGPVPTGARFRWTVGVPWALAPPVPGVPLLPLEAAGDRRRAAFLRSRPEYRQATENPLLEAMSQGVELEYHTSLRTSLYGVLGMVLGSDRPKTTTYDAEASDTILLEDQLYVAHGPRHFLLSDVARFRAWTAGLGGRWCPWRSRTRPIEILLSGHAQIGILVYDIRQRDSGLTNQTLLSNGLPIGKHQVGTLDARNIRLKGLVSGFSGSTNLRFPVRGPWGIDLGAGASLLWVGTLQGEEVSRSAAFTHSAIQGFIADSARAPARRNVEWSEGNLLGNGKVQTICPSGGKCPGAKGVPVPVERAPKLLLMPFIRMSLLYGL